MNSKIKTWRSRLVGYPADLMEVAVAADAEIAELRAALENSEKMSSVYLADRNQAWDKARECRAEMGSLRAALDRMKAVHEFAELVARPRSEPLNSVVTYRDNQSRSDMAMELRNKARFAIALAQQSKNDPVLAATSLPANMESSIYWKGEKVTTTERLIEIVTAVSSAAFDAGKESIINNSGREAKEQAQRDLMKQRFTNRSKTDATADFDLPSENDITETHRKTD